MYIKKSEFPIASYCYPVSSFTLQKKKLRLVAIIQGDKERRLLSPSEIALLGETIHTCVSSVCWQQIRSKGGADLYLLSMAALCGPPWGTCFSLHLNQLCMSWTLASCPHGCLIAVMLSVPYLPSVPACCLLPTHLTVVWESLGFLAFITILTVASLPCCVPPLPHLSVVSVASISPVLLSFFYFQVQIFFLTSGCAKKTGNLQQKAGSTATNTMGLMCEMSEGRTICDFPWQPITFSLSFSNLQQEHTNLKFCFLNIHELDSFPLIWAVISKKCKTCTEENAHIAYTSQLATKCPFCTALQLVLYLCL